MPTPEGGGTTTGDPVKTDKSLERGAPSKPGDAGRPASAATNAPSGSNPPPRDTTKGDKGK